MKFFSVRLTNGFRKRNAAKAKAYGALNPVKAHVIHRLITGGGGAELLIVEKDAAMVAAQTQKPPIKGVLLKNACR